MLYQSLTQIKRFHILGQLAHGPHKSMAISEEGFALYGVGELCEWLWDNQEFPCLLFITSSGGDMDATHALLAAMKHHDNCHTFGIGHVGSAGVDILHAGKTSGLHPDTCLMTHRGTRLTNRKLREMCEARDRKTYIDAPEILKNWHTIFAARDRYWSAEEAKEQGFVQYVSDAPFLDGTI